jgi:glycosyltransferase involved in cell wall biosynthesis
VRVLIVTRNLNLPSGLTNVVLDYVRSFPRDRIEVEHASFETPEPSLKRELESRGIPTCQLDDRRSFTSLSILHRLLKDRRVDLIVGTSWKPYVLAALARKGTKTQSAAWIHGIPLAVEGTVRKYIYRIVYRHRPILFASRAVQCAHSYRSHAGREYVVYAGIAPLPSLYPRGMRTTIGVPNDAFVVGYTAQFVGWKNHKVLLKVASTLAEKYPSLHIVLIGAGPTCEEVAQMCTALGLGGRVHFLGNRSDAKELLGTFDAYIHPSDGEAFGLALAEAMLAGLPVLASNTGAFPEIIENEITGLLVPPHDVSKICEGLVRLINDPMLRLELGQRAQQAISTRFTPEKFTATLTEAFENAISC